MCVIYNNNNYYYIYIYIYLQHTHTNDAWMNLCCLAIRGPLLKPRNYALRAEPCWLMILWVYGLYYPILLGMITIYGKSFWKSGNLHRLNFKQFFYKGWGFWRHFLDASLLHCSNFLRMTSLLEVLKGYPGAPTRPDSGSTSIARRFGGFVSRSPAGWCRGFYYPISIDYCCSTNTNRLWFLSYYPIDYCCFLFDHPLSCFCCCTRIRM